MLAEQDNQLAVNPSEASRANLPQQSPKMGTATTCFILAYLLLVCLGASKAVSTIGDCKDDNPVSLLCQSCAKYAHSVNAFDLCCKKDIDGNNTVRTWCRAFLPMPLHASMLPERDVMSPI